jgi:acyl-CoA dehydrogenase
MTDSTLIVDTTERIFRELGRPQTMRDEAKRTQLWRALDDAGLTRAWIDESLNGSGATIADGFDIVRIAGAHAVNVPLAETLLGSWLLAQAKIPTPDGALAVAPVQARDRIALNGGTLSGRVRGIAFASEADHLALFAEREGRCFVALVKRSACEIEPSNNLAGDASDTLLMRDVSPVVCSATALSRSDLLLMGAALRATQMAGALQSVLDLAVAHANERIAFEKPIGKFQAIQHSLAKLAGEAAAALAAAGSAADAIASSSSFDDAIFLEVASAKIRVGEAVTTGTAIAHQVHGAIGFSREHVLHRYTQRLWAWRDDFGGETEWSVKLGQLVARNGAEALWPTLAAR